MAQLPYINQYVLGQCLKSITAMTNNTGSNLSSSNKYQGIESYLEFSSFLLTD